jgi:hypothetical protein
MSLALTPRTSKGIAARNEYQKQRNIRLIHESINRIRAPISPRGEQGRVQARASAEESKEELKKLVAEQSGQNQECIGQGCMGKLKSGLSRISKVVGLSGGRRKTRRVGRKAHHAVRKTRHSRR